MDVEFKTIEPKIRKFSFFAILLLICNLFCGINIKRVCRLSVFFKKTGLLIFI
jgi:hypothetical protein